MPLSNGFTCSTENHGTYRVLQFTEYCLSPISINLLPSVLPLRTVPRMALLDNGIVRLRRVLNKLKIECNCIVEAGKK